MTARNCYAATLAPAVLACFGAVTPTESAETRCKTATHCEATTAAVAAPVAGIEAELDHWAAATSAWLQESGKITGTAMDKFIHPTDMERVDALANFSPHATSRYTKGEWFKLPMATGRPHVTGPCIDLLCTDEYVLTFTHPLYKDGVFAGVAGLDVTTQTLKRTTRGLLRDVGPHAVLVNADGRSTVSAGADVDAGDVVQAADGAQQYAAGRAFRIISATA